METEDIRKELVTGLKNTTAEIVHIGNVSQVIDVLGVAKTEELAHYVTEMQQAPMKKIKANSAIKQEKRIQRSGVAGFNRLELLKELENARPKDVPSTGQRDVSKVTINSQRSSGTSTKNPADPASGS